jgi:hypothetical protein
MLVGVTLIGAGLAGVGVKSLVDNERFLAKTPVADGRRTSTRSCGSPLPVAGRAVPGRPHSNPPHHRIGGSSSVLYDAANPQQVKFDTRQNRRGEGVLLIASGLGLIALFAALYVLHRSGQLHRRAARLT